MANRKWLHPVPVLLYGAAAGVLSKLLDIYTTNLGNIFSECSIWIFLCVWIALYSSSALRAAGNVLLFCVGMVCTYYVTAEVLSSPYSMTFVIGWGIFSVCTPFMGYVAWFAKGRGWLSICISAAILILLFAVSIVLFDGPRFADIVIAAALAVLLFWKKVRR